MTAVFVALAGAAGVLARFGVVQATGPTNSDWVVAAINVLGSFALGALVGAGVGGRAGVALGAGFLGGFTTFSTFTVDVVRTLESGQSGRALALVAASVGLGIGAAALGWAIAARAT